MQLPVDEIVTTAIATDRTLTERQRTTLLQIYAAFQAENGASAQSTTGTHTQENE